jgi:RimJ/RimL family protein N-acetyltransferase
MTPYKIITNRLIIRCYELTDAAQLKSAIDESIDHLLPWMPWAKYEPETIEQKTERLKKFREEFESNLDYTFGIFALDNKTLIGSTGLHTRQGDDVYEIGYWIRKSEIKKGYALEATMALTKVGLEIAHKTRIEIHCDPNNIDSLNIPKKLGFTHQTTLTNRKSDSGESLSDNMIWTLSKEDFENSDIKEFKLKSYL